jgi:hypothetical protein
VLPVSVIHIVHTRVQNGRIDEYLETTRLAAKLVERHGGRNIRVMRCALGVEGYGTNIFTSEHDSLEAFGAYHDEVNADAEIIALLRQVHGPDSPSTVLDEFVVNEIPLGRPIGEPGRVTAVFVTRVRPGAFEAAVDLGRQGIELLEAHGARNGRLWQQVFAGTASDLTAVAVELDSMRSLGKMMDGAASDPKGAALQAVVQAPDSPVAFVSNEVYIDIPL